MSQLQRLIAGLALVEGRVVASSFYNSSGDTAVFRLKEPLTPAEVTVMQTLGFGYYWDEIIKHGNVSFQEWSEA